MVSHVPSTPHGTQWKNTMVLYRNPMVFHGVQCHTHGVPWKIYMVSDGKPLVFHGKPKGHHGILFLREETLQKTF